MEIHSKRIEIRLALNHLEDAAAGDVPRGLEPIREGMILKYIELHHVTRVTPSYTELHRVRPESPKFSSSIPSSVGQRSFYMFYCNSANVKIQADPYFSMPLFHTFLPFQAINLFQHVNPRIQRCGDVAMSRAACAMRLLHTCRTITAKRAKEL